MSGSYVTSAKQSAWFLALSPREQRKQVRRWRYHRMYQRRRIGDRWEIIHGYELMTR